MADWFKPTAKCTCLTVLVTAASLASCTRQDDTSPTVDASAQEAGISDSAVEPPRDAGAAAPLASLSLRDGGLVRGVLASRYDHALFWDASADTTFGIFESSGYADYPGDRSMHFVSSRDVVQAQGLPPDTPDPRFVQFLRNRDIVIGRPPLDGVSLIIAGNESYHLQEDGYGNFAWDLVRTRQDGVRFSGQGTQNADYFTWDERVVLPTAGVVVEVERSAPDNAPGAYPPGAINNLVGVYLGGHYYVYILHFRQNTIPSAVDGSCAPQVPGIPCVKVGTWLPAGAYLGRAGNSGVTLEPHVHLTLMYYDVTGGKPRTWSIPSEFANVHASSKPVGPSVAHEHLVPKGGTYVSAKPF